MAEAAIQKPHKHKKERKRKKSSSKVQVPKSDQEQSIPELDSDIPVSLVNKETSSVHEDLSGKIESNDNTLAKENDVPKNLDVSCESTADDVFIEKIDNTCGGCGGDTSHSGLYLEQLSADIEKDTTGQSGATLEFSENQLKQPILCSEEKSLEISSFQENIELHKTEEIENNLEQIGNEGNSKLEAKEEILTDQTAEICSESSELQLKFETTKKKCILSPIKEIDKMSSLIDDEISEPTETVPIVEKENVYISCEENSVILDSSPEKTGVVQSLYPDITEEDISEIKLDAFDSKPDNDESVVNDEIKLSTSDMQENKITELLCNDTNIHKNEVQMSENLISSDHVINEPKLENDITGSKSMNHSEIVTSVLVEQEFINKTKSQNDLIEKLQTETSSDYLSSSAISKTCIVDELKTELLPSAPVLEDASSSSFSSITSNVKYNPLIVSKSLCESDLSEDNISTHETVSSPKMGKLNFVSNDQIASPKVRVSPSAPALDLTSGPVPALILSPAVTMQNDKVDVTSPHKLALSPLKEQPTTLSPELKEHVNDVNERKIVHKKIVSNRLSTIEGVLKPFTDSQLKALYYNPELEANQLFIEDFVEEHRRLISHEFHELLLGYMRARSNLQLSTKEIQSLQNEFYQVVEHLWITTEHTISAKGHCEDGKLVSGSHTYNKSVFNDSAAVKVDRLLKQIREQIHDHFCLYAYASQMGRLQIEAYMHNLLLSSPDLKNLPHNTPIQGCQSSQITLSVSAQVQNLKRCISILFHFQRKPIKDKQFINDTRIWLTRLIAVLLRVATYEDHLFLLNHILRCPAGVGDWAAVFLQLPPLPVCLEQNSFGDPSLDHTITVLANLLLPVQGREEFLQHVKSAVLSNSRQDVDNLWVLIDSEGEEDDDPSNYWLHWRENDLVALLNQIPWQFMFRHLLHIDFCDGQDVYDINLTTEQSLLKILAFATQLVHILRDGLKTFNLVRYRQLTKRLSRLIRHTVQYVSDHWLNFKNSHSSLDPAMLLRLQVEFDQFFRRATRCIFSSQRLGAWQFMAGLPYTCVSTSMLWQIILMLHSNSQENHDTAYYSEAYVDLQDKAIKMQFEESLMSMPECEAYYLLTTFANMACSRDHSAAYLIETIALEIYEIAFVSNHTREMCSKGGRELLALVASKHPFILSRLIHRVKETMTQVGMVSLYLFRELPFYLWQPQDDDLLVVEDWLLSGQLTSPPNLLARLVLANMNWGCKDDELCLDISLHRKVALLIVDAYAKLVPGKGSIITESFKQVSNIASIVCQTPTPEQAFCQWAWDLLLQLRLHLFSLPVKQIHCALANPAQAFLEIPCFDRDESIKSLACGIKDKQPAACYVALAMTTFGHSIAEYGKNLSLLNALVEGHHYRAAIHIFSLISSLFYTSGNNLSSCEKIVPIIQSLLMCDLTYVKMAKNLVLPEFPGRYLRMFVAMILHSADMASSINSASSAVYLMWLEVVCSLHQWSHDRNALYVVDSICQAAFMDQNVAVFVKDFFLNHYKATISTSRFNNPVSSFLNWVATGISSSPLLLSRQSCVEFPWFTYFALDVETQVEEETGLWKNLAFEMLSNTRSAPDAALKKVASKLHMSTPPVQQLAIYHWAQQALDNLPDHPLTHLFWQRFFGLYLQRWPFDVGQPDRGSVGARFFDSMSNLHLLKRMKKRLHELADYHNKQAKELAKIKKQDGETENETEEALKHEMKVLTRAKHHSDLAKLYGTLVLWIEESKLHDGSLYLPSLPRQYDSPRLLLLQQNDKSPWLEFIDFDLMKQEHDNLIQEWTNSIQKKFPQPSNNIREDTATESILKRLKSYESPKPPPPIVPLRAPVPDINESIFTNEKTSLRALQDHLRVLTEYAKSFSYRVNHHVVLDSDYMDLIPYLYKNVDSEVSVLVACKQMSTGILRSSDIRCNGPACIILKFKAKKLIDGTQSRLDQNRSDWQELINEILLPPPQNVCSSAVYTENALIHLVKKFQHQKGLGESLYVKQLKDIGVALFYHFHKLITPETSFYSPTRQFFTSSIEILGQEFISGNGDQCETLVSVILKNPHSVGLLAPHFTPAAANKNVFIQLYSQMVAVNELHSPDLAFVLLTKFDVNSWLATHRPRLSERQQIFHTIGEVLLSMGLHPDSSLLPISEIYRNHLQIILLYQFPDHYSDALQLLFKGSDFHMITADVWWDLMNSLLMENRAFPLCSFNMEELKNICTKFAHTQIMFTTQQLRETLELFYNHFSQKRQSSKDATIYGLYSKYQPYVNCIASFLALIAHGFIASAKRDSNKNFEQVADREIWPEICKAFSPWIQPLHIGGKFLMPWIPDDMHLATIMISSFVESVKFLHLLTNYSSLLVASFFEYYNAVCNAQEASPCVLVSCYNKVFQSLEWTHFHLNQRTMQLMMKILNTGSAECLHLLGNILTQLQWPAIVESWIHFETPLTLIQHISDISYMLVRLSFEQTLKQDGSIPALLQSVELFPWHFIDANTYETLTKCFITNCDYECIFATEKTLHDSAALRFLKVCAGFVSWTTELHHESQRKQCSLLRMIVQILSLWTNKNKSKLKAYHDNIVKILVELLQEVEQVVNKRKNGSLFEESVPLLTEILNLLNSTSVAALQDICIHAIMSWAASNPCSFLLPPCLRSVCCSLASVAHMVLLSEAIVNTYFSADPKECTCLSIDCGWNNIIAAIQVPDSCQGEFFSECLNQSSFLTLYSSIVHHQLQCFSLDDELNLLNKVVQWSTNIRPLEDSEGKLLLFWNKVVEIAVHIAASQEDMKPTTKVLISFCDSLIQIGEDKSSLGLLGAIGLGKKSPYSSRFRLAARAVAAFISSQITSDGTLRFKAEGELDKSPKSSSSSSIDKDVMTQPQQTASFALIQLEACKGNKLYSQWADKMDYLIDFVKNPENSIYNFKTLLAYLTGNLFPEKNYLLITRHGEQIGLQLCALYVK